MKKLSNRFGSFSALLALLILVLLLAFFWLVTNRVTVEPPSPHYDVDEELVPTPEPGMEENDTYKERPPFDIPSVGMAATNSLRWRIGVGIPDGDPLRFNWSETRPGWYLDWSTNLEHRVWLPNLLPGGVWTNVWMQPDDRRLGMEFVPMVRVFNGIPYPNPGVLRKLAQQNPGKSWLVGNEPDVKWQDNATPSQYVDAYYQVYHAIKRGDPTAQVAIAGFSQITPLRLQYLDRVWTLYQERHGEPMPVDIWNMHAFVLREEAKSWGVEIPPGDEFKAVQHGEQWEIKDHNDLRLVEGQVRLMRQWMKEHGQQAKPLWITEYGILIPASLGFPPSVVIQFMEGSFDLFDRLADPILGYPADENRLVQRWVWFSTHYERYPAGNLFNGRGRSNPTIRALSKYLNSNGE